MAHAMHIIDSFEHSCEELVPWEGICWTVCDIESMQVQLRPCMRGGAREGGRGREEEKEAGCMNACMNACMRKTVLCMKACIANNPFFCRGKIGEVYSCDISCAWTVFLMRHLMRHSCDISGARRVFNSCGIHATSQAPGEQNHCMRACMGKTVLLHECLHECVHEKNRPLHECLHGKNSSLLST